MIAVRSHGSHLPSLPFTHVPHATCYGPTRPVLKPCTVMRPYASADEGRVDEDEGEDDGNEDGFDDDGDEGGDDEEEDGGDDDEDEDGDGSVGGRRGMF